MTANLNPDSYPKYGSVFLIAEFRASWLSTNQGGRSDGRANLVEQVGIISESKGPQRSCATPLKPNGKVPQVKVSFCIQSVPNMYFPVFQPILIPNPESNRHRPHKPCDTCWHNYWHDASSKGKSNQSLRWRLNRQPWASTCNRSSIANGSSSECLIRKPRAYTKETRFPRSITQTNQWHTRSSLAITATALHSCQEHHMGL